MKAIVFHKSSAGHVLRLEEIEKPLPIDDEVLIKVYAASVNPLDYHVLRHPLLRGVFSSIGKLKLTRPGRDLAGQVEAIGPNVTQLKIGDDVFGACNGAFAEYACARETAFAILPATVSFEQGAAVPIAGLTALQGLQRGLGDKGKIRPGQRVLINGAAGGIGTFAVQIAKTFGAEVTGVCSTRNMEMVRSIGADFVIDYTREDFTKNGQRYDVIFDLVANHSFSDRRRALTARGIYIGAGMVGRDLSIPGLLTGMIKESILALFASQKFTSVLGKLKQKDLATIGALISEGKITPVIDRRYSLSEVPDAVRYVEERHARGKVIIDIEQSGVVR